MHVISILIPTLLSVSAQAAALPSTQQTLIAPITLSLTSPPLDLRPLPDDPLAALATDYLPIINKWRNRLGKSSLTLSTQLQSNAQKTVNDGNGQMIHQLNPGTRAQVLAQSSPEQFENAFVGGWLCEVPNVPGLGSEVCSVWGKGWNYAGQTGHAEICSSEKYSHVGCAVYMNIWACDFGVA
ncbi:unnamed protein product [Periconia digitata]|uniref:SCP domain-containing protein n=1 Tax=Periconia digitata TaxID=1303443 RepID=A0A9W4U4R2_9PLEO|nr:unnamed protein product [Periconia digitata]